MIQIIYPNISTITSAILLKRLKKKFHNQKSLCTDYLKQPLENTFFKNPTTPEDVKSEIKTLKNNKASGPSSIRNKVFKTFTKPLSKPLADLINLFFRIGKFPSCLKTAKVIPVLKKGDNYRPISLISNISKIIEKLMHSRLYTYILSETMYFTACNLVLEMVTLQHLNC